MGISFISLEFHSKTKRQAEKFPAVKKDKKWSKVETHVCSQDCSWENDGEVFTSVEQDYQYEKLNSHNKWEAADALMQVDNTLDIKQSAQATLPEEEVSQWWSACEQDKMLEACRQKFQFCEHAREALLNSKSELAEAILDHKWGTGLSIDYTVECLPNFWPGQNLIGRILKQVHSELLESRHLQLVEQVKDHDDSKK